jgi:hypothetical protein
MLRIAFQFIALLLSFVQSTTTLPLRNGEMASQLTDEELFRIQAVVPPGARPWLLNGILPQWSRGQFIQVFLTPTTSTDDLRRGTVISVERRNRRNRFQKPDASDPWVVERTESYAQVAMAGRSFDDIRGERDLNLPFRVIGSFDDSEIVGSIQAMRADPAPMPWPILSMTRKPDGSVEVQTLKNHSEGELIWLRKAGQEWKVSVAGAWAY